MESLKIFRDIRESLKFKKEERASLETHGRGRSEHWPVSLAVLDSFRCATPALVYPTVLYFSNRIYCISLFTWLSSRTRRGFIITSDFLYFSKQPFDVNFPDISTNPPLNNLHRKTSYGSQTTVIKKLTQWPFHEQRPASLLVLGTVTASFRTREMRHVHKYKVSTVAFDYIKP